MGGLYSLQNTPWLDRHGQGADPFHEGTDDVPVRQGMQSHMAAVNQLPQVKVNQWYTRESLDHPIQEGFEGPKDPEACLPLHLSEVLQSTLVMGVLEVPESSSIGSSQKNTGPVEKTLMIGLQSPD